ncbi:MAG: DedA family protein [Bacillota bacterium]|nr:DedA family protein [Bacillota bacterium]
MELILDYLTTLGLGGIAVGMLLEALGVPFFPGGVMIILAGFLVNQGVLGFHAALGAAFAGYTVGSSAAYIMGKNIGLPAVRRLGRWIRLNPEKLVPERLPARSAGAFVLLGRFLPGLGNLTPYLAGVAHLQWGLFMLYNSIFGLVWGTLYLLIGMFFGHNWPVIVAFIQPRLVGLAILGILVTVTIILIRRERGVLGDVPRGSNVRGKGFFGKREGES